MIVCVSVVAELAITFHTDLSFPTRTTGSSADALDTPRRPSAMSLGIRNLQRAVPLRRAPLRRQVELLRRILGVRKFDLGLVCVDNRRMQRINGIYRGKNVPTDVLSFPFHEVKCIFLLVSPTVQCKFPVLMILHTVFGFYLENFEIHTKVEFIPD